MCGIAGIYSYVSNASFVDADELIRIRDHMTSRGPDDQGLWLSNDRRIGLAHRRLSIIDLSEQGHQPMSTKDGRLIVTFNGEIYNHIALRTELERKGYVFRSSSDTEVLLHLYDEYGVEMVKQLRGMFAFAIYDVPRRQLFLARDPYGIKPLFFADDGRTFRFASQVKALIAGGAISREISPAGWAGFYLFGSVPEPFTTCRDIRALPAGSTMLLAEGAERQIQPFFSIAEVYCQSIDSAAAFDEKTAETLREALLDSVRHHLVSDVPVGCFLSSGIDSCVLLALMSEISGTEVTAITLGFEEFRGTANDETPMAKIAADAYGASHHVRMVGSAEFRADLPKILSAMDQPSIDGINTWFVSKAARELGLRVAVSGLGGDELFGGYPSFSDVPAWHKRFYLPSHIPLLGTVTRRIVTSTQKMIKVGSPKTGGLFELGGSVAGAYLLRRGLFMPWELDGVMGKELAREGLKALDPLELISSVLDPQPFSDFGRVATLESCLYMRNQLLRDSDWASMSHSLEVRVPLVDHELLQQIAHMPKRSGKQDMASVVSQSLPEAIVNKPKTGFSTPVSSWLSTLFEDEELSGSSVKRIERPLTALGSREWARTLAALWQGGKVTDVTERKRKRTGIA